MPRGEVADDGRVDDRAEERRDEERTREDEWELLARRLERRADAARRAGETLLAQGRVAFLLVAALGASLLGPGAASDVRTLDGPRAVSSVFVGDAPNAWSIASRPSTSNFPPHFPTLPPRPCAPATR